MLRTELTAIELILNIMPLTERARKYWEDRRHEVLKKILENQIENFNHD